MILVWTLTTVSFTMSSDRECSVMSEFFAVQIEDLSTINTAANSLRDTGTFVIDPFLSPHGLLRLQQDILSVPYNHQHIYRSVFQDMGDFTLFPDAKHSRNRVGFVSLGHTNRNDLPVSFEELYAFPPLLSILKAIVAESRIYGEHQDVLYLSKDKEGAIYSLFAEGGDHGSWHYDQHPFSCVLMVHKPVSGGTFEFVRLDPTEPDQEYWRTLEMIWDRESTIEMEIGNIEVNEGGLYCFSGNTTLHQVTKVQGDRIRAVIVMAYATESEFQHSDDISNINFVDGIDKVVHPEKGRHLGLEQERSPPIKS